MARTSFVLGIWILAISLGILGYQGLTFYFYQNWPAVSLGFGWQAFFAFFGLGDFWRLPPSDLHDELSWLAKMPLVPAGIILSYVLFLLSDTLRGRAGRSQA